MQFFCFHRDRSESLAVRLALTEQHWAYMDGFSSSLSLRGPTFDEESVVTGSVHVVDVESAEQAWWFALREPGYQAGAYRDVMIRRWRDVLGRTMWDYPGRDDPDGLFLVLGFEREPRQLQRGSLPEGDLVAFGHLMSDDGEMQLGTAAIVRAESPAAAATILDGRALVGIEIHRWTFGGRR